MFTRHVSVLAGLVLAVLSAVPAAASSLLTLERTLADVENVNLSVLIGRESVEQSEQSVRSARSLVLPEVTLRANQFRRDTGPGRPFSTFDAGLYGTMPLLDLRAFDSLKAVKRSVDVTRFRYEQAVQQVLAAVAATYFEHRRDLASASVIEANIERAQVLLDLARNRLRAGVATQIEVTRAEAELLTAEQARLQQETVTLASALRLKRLLNLDLDLAVELEPFDVRRELDLALRQLPLEVVLEQRADFQAALAELDRLKLARRAYARERAPTVDAVVQGGVQSETPLDGRDERFWAAGVQVSVPVFEGNRIDSNLRRTDSEIRQADYDRVDLEREIATELRLALQDVESQLAQIEVAEKNLLLAAEELRLARVRYEQGVADNRELIEAENRFTSTSFNRVRSIYSYHVARVELARVRGDVRLILQERAPVAPAEPAPTTEPAP